MAWSFGDGFDCYASGADLPTGYWDSSTGTPSNITLVAGRFAGSQAAQFTNNPTVIKNSTANDAVHHLVVAFKQTAAITGTTLAQYFTLGDGATAQCSVVFRSDGAILLTSGGPTGTVLDTYTGAFPVTATWYMFEFEIIISNTVGRFRVRKNGNTVDDYDSTAIRDTQNSVNAYANRLTVGMQVLVAQQIDDLFWRSDASSVAWMGDIRCYTRMPASDASVQFSRAGTGMTGYQGVTPQSVINTAADYTSIVSTLNGSVSQIQLSMSLAHISNVKCTVFANYNNAGTDQPGTIISSATPLNNPLAGPNTFTFSTPFTVVRGTKYWVGLMWDTGGTNVLNRSTGLAGSFCQQLTTTYAAFPTATPTVTSFSTAVRSVQMIVSQTSNYPLVAEEQQDGAVSYVYSGTAGDSDFYGIGSIVSAPVSTFAVTTRALMIKSDAGTRTAAVQLKSGGTTVASPTIVLTPSNWTWAWRHDTTDPATGVAWTAVGVNTAQVGPTVIA